MALNTRVGRAVLEISTDHSSYDAGISHVKSTQQQLKQSWQSIGGDIRVISKQINDYTKDFAGSAMLQRANAMAAAVQKIGGAQNLTHTNQSRVNRTMKEALEQYQVLGLKAPKAMLDIERATRSVDAPTQGLTTRMIGLGAAVGSFVGTLASNAVMQAGRALVQMGKDAFTSAGQILDLSDKTGLSTATIQRMQFVAKQTSTSLEAMTGNAFKLGVNIASGNKAIRAAVEDLRQYGVEWSTLQQMSPDQQWDLITKALGRVASEQERNRLGVALFGRQFSEIAPAIAQGYADIAGGAKLSSDAQLRALDVAGDRWDKFVENTKANVRSFLGDTILMADAIRKASEEAKKAAGDRAFLVGVDFGAPSRERLRRPVYDRPAGPPIPQSVIASTDTYRQRLAEVRAELAKLTAAERGEIDAALKLDESHEALEKRFKLTAGALRFYESQAKEADKATDKYADTVDKFTDAAKKREALILAQLLSRGQIQLADATEEHQREIAKALQAGTDAWRVQSEVVPQLVQQQLDAVNRLRTVPDILKAAYALERTTARSLSGLPGAGRDEQADAIGRSIDAQEQARRAAAATGNTIEFQRAEYAIEQARRVGTSWQQIAVMEADLSQRKLQAAIATAEQEFRDRTRLMERTTQIGQDEYATLETDHRMHVQQMVEDWEHGEILKRRELQRTHDRWLRTADIIKNRTRQLWSDISGNLGGLFFGLGHDLSGELRVAADDAKVEYDRIKATGKATADQLKAAFDRWREAEDRANYTFAERFKSMWLGIKQTLIDILNDLLKYFLESFIAGMVKGIAGAKLGERIGSSLTSGLPGGGGGGGNIVSSLAQKGISKLFGLGGGASSAFTVGTAATSTTLASSAIPTSLAMTAVPGTVTAGTASAGGAAAGGAGGAGGLGFLTNPAFWTNPWTIAGIGAFALGMAVWKKGLFRGGWEGVEGNKRRDKFLGQWGDPSNKGVGGAGHNMAAEITEMTGEHGGGSYYRNLQRADSKKEFESAQDAIIRLYASKKSKKKIQKFHEGGVIGDENVSTSHLLSGETLIKALRGESVLTRQATAMLGAPMIAALNARRGGGGGFGSMLGIRAGAPKMIAPALPRADLIAPTGGAAGDAAMQPIVVNNNVTNHFAGQLDRNIIKDQVIPEINKALRFNTGDLAVNVGRYGNRT